MKEINMAGSLKDPGILREIKKGLRKVYGAKLVKIILYGSYARGEQAFGSDLDVG